MDAVGLGAGSCRGFERMNAGGDLIVVAALNDT